MLSTSIARLGLNDLSASAFIRHHASSTFPPLAPGDVKSLVILDDLDYKTMNKTQKRNVDRLFGYVLTHKQAAGFSGRKRMSNLEDLMSEVDRFPDSRKCADGRQAAGDFGSEVEVHLDPSKVADACQAAEEFWPK